MWSGVIFVFGARGIVHLFTSDPAVAEYARTALRVIAIGFVLYAVRHGAVAVVQRRRRHVDTDVARVLLVLDVRDTAGVPARGPSRVRPARRVHRDPDRVLGVRDRGARDVPARRVEGQRWFDHACGSPPTRRPPTFSTQSARRSPSTRRSITSCSASRKRSRRGARLTTACSLASVDDVDGLALAALMTRGSPLLIASDRADVTLACGLLLDALCTRQRLPKYVIGTVGQVERLVEQWTRESGGRATVAMRQRAYKLTALDPLPPTFGKLAGRDVG